MSFASACPCFGPFARLVRIRSGGSLGLRNSVRERGATQKNYYVPRSSASDRAASRSRDRRRRGGGGGHRWRCGGRRRGRRGGRGRGRGRHGGGRRRRRR